MFDITSLVPIILPIIIAIAAYLYHYLVARSPANIQKLITQLSATVVPAIEQIGTDMSSNRKKQTATQNIQGILKGLHVDVPPQLIDLAIESAVHELNLYSRSVVGAQFIAPPAPSQAETANTDSSQAQIVIPSDMPTSA